MEKREGEREAYFAGKFSSSFPPFSQGETRRRGEKGKGGLLPRFPPSLKSDHGKASKLNENGGGRRGLRCAKIRKGGGEGLYGETAASVCGWAEEAVILDGRRRRKSDRLCHLSHAA